MSSLCSLAVSLVIAGVVLAATIPDLQWMQSSWPFYSLIHTMTICFIIHSSLMGMCIVIQLKVGVHGLNEGAV